VIIAVTYSTCCLANQRWTRTSAGRSVCEYPRQGVLLFLVSLCSPVVCVFFAEFRSLKSPWIAKFSYDPMKVNFESLLLLTNISYLGCRL